MQRMQRKAFSADALYDLGSRHRINSPRLSAVRALVRFCPVVAEHTEEANARASSYSSCMQNSETRAPFKKYASFCPLHACRERAKAQAELCQEGHPVAKDLSGDERDERHERDEKGKDIAFCPA